MFSFIVGVIFFSLSISMFNLFIVIYFSSQSYKKYNSRRYDEQAIKNLINNELIKGVNR